MASLLLSSCATQAKLSSCPDPLWPPDEVAEVLEGFEPGSLEDKWVVDYVQQQRELEALQK